MSLLTGVDPEIVAKCRVYLTDTRVPSVTLKDGGGIFRSWSLRIMEIPFFKAWPKVTWMAVDRAVVKAFRNNLPMPEKMLHRLGMEIVLSNGCPTPVLSVYLGYFWESKS